MKILLAFDKFKDSMAATGACDAARHAIEASLAPETEVLEAPLTDGGEGFCRILAETAGGDIEYHAVTGPLGEETDAPLGWVDAAALNSATCGWLGASRGRIAVIEMASVAGLEQVPFELRHPNRCTTRGVGELMRISATEGADAILLGIGGSATSDLGFGALEALGLRFGLDAPITPANWPEVNQIGGQIDVDLPPVFIACDVDNPLLGPRGAAAVYGPQKGLGEEEIAIHDRLSGQLAAKLCDLFDIHYTEINTPGTGAAGGIGFGLKVALQAHFIPGFQLVQAWLALPQKIGQADLILTGEGKFDESSLAGKGPYALLLAAREQNKAACLLAGAIDPTVIEKLQREFPKVIARAITPPGTDLETALARGPENLKNAVRTALEEIAAR